MSSLELHVLRLGDVEASIASCQETVAKLQAALAETPASNPSELVKPKLEGAEAALAQLLTVRRELLITISDLIFEADDPPA